MAELKLPKEDVEKLEVDRTDTDGLPVLDKYKDLFFLFQGKAAC